ncbi:MAG: PHP domain-containing protein [Phycisphaerales bacterium]
MTDKYTNMHFHTHFSFNAENYSPSEIALRSKQANLAAAGIVDFDVLDGLDEFFASALKLGLKACGGIETRVFVPQFADKVINSPGEPGIAYHMGTGIPSGKLASEQKQFIDKLRSIAANRNLEIVKRVNQYLSPVVLDYDKDVLPLTPKGNVTERHICFAYANKANDIFPDKKQLAEFWKSKIGVEDISNKIALLNTIRAKTMKMGGIGYVKPDAKSFPTMTEMNEFVISVGGIPTLAWLDGSSEGEKKINELLTIAISSGVEAVNIIPDRNYKPGLGLQDQKKKNLYDFVKICNDLDLSIIAGTEMNSPGQKFVDNFDSDELKPLTDTFLKGALIIYGHTVLQRQCGLGYKSKWAAVNFKTRAEKNKFYAEIGQNIQPVNENILAGFAANSSPSEILKKVKR